MPRFGLGVGIGHRRGRARQAATPGVLLASTSYITLAAQDASLRIDRVLTAAQASLSLATQDASLTIQRLAQNLTLTANPATLSLTFESMTPITDRIMPADQASISLDTKAAGLLASRVLTAAQASVSLATQDASLTKSGGGGGFAPSDITNLELWYKADGGVFTDAGGTTPATNGQAVARWNDNSGNGRHLLQATSFKRPTLNTSGMGSGKPALILEQPQNSSMQTASGLTLSGVPLTVVVVMKMNSGTDNFGRLLCYCQPGKADYQGGSWVLSRATSNNNIRIDVFASGFLDYGTITPGTEYILSATRDASLATSYIGNVQYAQLTSANGAMVTGGMFSIGEFLQNAAPQGTNFWDGAISEILVYSKVLDSTERGQVQTYLSGRW